MISRRGSNRKNDQSGGFIMVELIIAIVILVVVLVGYLQLFVYCLGLAETSGNITLATTEAQDKLEQMRNHNFDTLVFDYSSGGFPGDTFILNQLSGTGVIYFIPGANPQLHEVEIVVSWVDEKNRNIGGTDEDGDNRIDSPVELKSIIGRR
ncbi:hypothetical protein ACFL2J_03510 [Candidatus Omnitrophota bacterium]